MATDSYSSLATVQTNTTLRSNNIERSMAKFSKKLNELQQCDHLGEKEVRAFQVGLYYLRKFSNKYFSVFADMIILWMDLYAQFAAKTKSPQEHRLFNDTLIEFTEHAGFFVTLPNAEYAFLEDIFRAWSSIFDHISDRVIKMIAAAIETDLLAEIFNEIAKIGHYQTQKAGLYILLKLLETSPDKMEEVIKRASPDNISILGPLFLNFNFKNAEVEFRKILNYINTYISSKSTVVSVKVRSGYMGDLWIKKPQQTGFKDDDFWIDFNREPGTISFSCCSLTFPENEGINRFRVLIEATIMEIRLMLNSQMEIKLCDIKAEPELRNVDAIAQIDHINFSITSEVREEILNSNMKSVTDEVSENIEIFETNVNSYKQTLRSNKICALSRNMAVGKGTALFDVKNATKTPQSVIISESVTIAETKNSSANDREVMDVDVISLENQIPVPNSNEIPSPTQEILNSSETLQKTNGKFKPPKELSSAAKNRKMFNTNFIENNQQKTTKRKLYTENLSELSHNSQDTQVHRVNYLKTKRENDKILKDLINLAIPDLINSKSPIVDNRESLTAATDAYTSNKGYFSINRMLQNNDPEIRGLTKEERSNLRINIQAINAVQAETARVFFKRPSNVRHGKDPYEMSFESESEEVKTAKDKRKITVSSMSADPKNLKKTIGVSFKKPKFIDKPLPTLRKQKREETGKLTKVKPVAKRKAEQTQLMKTDQPTTRQSLPRAKKPKNFVHFYSKCRTSDEEEKCDQAIATRNHRSPLKVIYDSHQQEPVQQLEEPPPQRPVSGDGASTRNNKPKYSKEKEDVQEIRLKRYENPSAQVLPTQSKKKKSFISQPEKEVDCTNFQLEMYDNETVFLRTDQEIHKDVMNDNSNAHDVQSGPDDLYQPTKDINVWELNPSKTIRRCLSEASIECNKESSSFLDIPQDESCSRAGHWMIQKYLTCLNKEAQDLPELLEDYLTSRYENNLDNPCEIVTSQNSSVENNCSTSEIKRRTLESDLSVVPDKTFSVDLDVQKKIDQQGQKNDDNNLVPQRDETKAYTKQGALVIQQTSDIQQVESVYGSVSENLGDGHALELVVDEGVEKSIQLVYKNASVMEFKKSIWEAFESFLIMNTESSENLKNSFQEIKRMSDELNDLKLGFLKTFEIKKENTTDYAAKFQKLYENYLKVRLTAFKDATVQSKQLENHTRVTGKSIWENYVRSYTQNVANTINNFNNYEA